MSPMLRGECAVLTNSAWVRRVPFFSKAPERERERLITQVTLRMQLNALAPREFVYHTGSEIDALFIIRRGVCTTVGGARHRMCTTGDYFGDDMIRARGKHNHAMRAITFLDLYVRYPGHRRY